MKKAQQCLHFLRRLRRVHHPTPILTTFYRGTIESLLGSCITAWFRNCTQVDRKKLQQVVRMAEMIIGVTRTSISDIYTTRYICKATSIVEDPTHPSHRCFSPFHLAEGTVAYGLSVPDYKTASSSRPYDSSMLTILSS